MTRTNLDRRPSACAIAIIALMLTAPAVHAQSAGQAGASPSSQTLEPGWNRIDGGPSTICSLGSPYAFFVAPGDARRLMVYFAGGGACWNAELCDDKARPRRYSAAVNPQRPRTGIFDTTRADNPVRDFTKVFVPYCTADVHLGARTTTYTLPPSNGEPERTIEIHHNGGANADAALKWIYAHVAAPQTILVTGQSAGSAATPFYAAVLAERYPAARVVQLGDASNAYEGAGAAAASWGVNARLRAAKAFRDLDTTKFNYLSLFELAARSSPRITFAVVNSVDDSTQAFYLRSLDDKSPTTATMLARHDRELSQAIPGYHSYTYPGWMHTIIGRPEFYTLAVDGIRLRDWVAQLVDGSPVRSVGTALFPRE
ncbi:MAG TPA: pectin acetylesterase-family hydrolase [Gemmatimonadaceae bacterium]|jgi:hypothetical protein|nr:pectin acetylesterase-family hydrolase [Gemmatimonadaceae bacterium]